jgi:hypothetical protein
LKGKNSVITNGSNMIELPEEVGSDLRENLFENSSNSVQKPQRQFLIYKQFKIIKLISVHYKINNSMLFNLMKKSEIDTC